MKQKLFTLLLLISITMNAFANDQLIGWGVTGSAPASYQLTKDIETGSPAPSGFLESTKTVRAGEFGASVQSFFPEQYLGERLRISAVVKTSELDNRAALWARVDTDKEHGVSFDNMGDRPITGDTDWTTYSLVIDVPKAAKSLNFGSLIVGHGKLWMDEFKFEIVDQSVPLTGIQTHLIDTPVNTSFND